MLVRDFCKKTLVNDKIVIVSNIFNGTTITVKRSADLLLDKKFSSKQVEFISTGTILGNSGLKENVFLISLKKEEYL